MVNMQSPRYWFASDLYLSIAAQIDRENQKFNFTFLKSLCGIEVYFSDVINPRTGSRQSSSPKSVAKLPPLNEYFLQNFLIAFVLIISNSYFDFERLPEILNHTFIFVCIKLIIFSLK
tara:strand:+ start:106289 stop:106642 length:354 start_codon:yes stop_codon:yes gene_type:complete